MKRLFDPTAHQFDNKGGVDLERYLVEGISLPVWRSAHDRVRAALVAASVRVTSTSDRLFARAREIRRKA